MNLKTIKFGCDAEFFIKTLAGTPFPVTGLLGGTKDKPIPVTLFEVSGYGIQEDNAAAEVNVPPTSSMIHLIRSLNSIVHEVRKRLPPSLVLDFDNASLEIPEAFVTQLGQLQEFGCEPDFNVWTQQRNPRPTPETIGFRSAAAHVHVSWNNPTDDERLEFIKWADGLVVCRDLEWENDSEKARRKLYGKAGAFRWKNYGIEHRVLSNRWAVNTTRAQKVLSNYLYAASAVASAIPFPKELAADVQQAINASNAELGGRLFAELMALLKSKVSNNALAYAIEVHA